MESEYVDLDRLEWLKEFRGKIRGVIDGSLDSATLASYSYSDADGSQSTTRRSPKELWDLLQEVEDEIENLERITAGGGVRTFGTRLRP